MNIIFVSSFFLLYYQNFQGKSCRFHSNYHNLTAKPKFSAAWDIEDLVKNGKKVKVSYTFTINTLSLNMFLIFPFKNEIFYCCTPCGIIFVPNAPQRKSSMTAKNY